MNKRLLLAFYDRSGLGAYMPVDYKGNELAVEEHWEKFAELIVRECAKAAGDFEYARLHDSLVEDHVLKHFGVEE